MSTLEISNGGSCEVASTRTCLVQRLQRPLEIVEELFTNHQKGVQSSESNLKSNDLCNNHSARPCICSINMYTI